MIRTNQVNRRGPARRLVPAAGVLVLGVVILIGLWYLMAGCLRSPNTPKPPKPPAAQPASCPDVLALAVPGTWESSSVDDPHAPHANPRSLVGYISRPLQQQFPTARAEVYTVPYVAQFSNPIAFPPDGQKSYNVSRTEGISRVTDKLADEARICPLTNYVVIGFSQGAVIAGDVAAQIAAGNGPIAPEHVLGVTLIADGRRSSDQGRPVGVVPDGVGAELALSGLRVPGISMTGPRKDGFGVLNDKVRTICAAGDMICASPPQALNIFNLLSSAGALVRSVGNPVHSGYNSYHVEPGGPTATAWTEQWAADLISSAPRPPHTSVAMR